MRRTIHAIAAGAAVWGVALAGPPVAHADDPSVDADTRAMDEPALLVAPHAGVDFSPGADDARSFAWTSDLSLTPPPYAGAPADSHLAPPSATATVIPLPAGVWTGFAGLGGLGAISLLRRMRRVR